MIKKGIDAVLLILFLMLLGYSFTGGRLHEILGLCFLALVLVHNLLNWRYYRALPKGTCSPKRKLAAAETRTGVVYTLIFLLDLFSP